MLVNPRTSAREITVFVCVCVCVCVRVLAAVFSRAVAAVEMIWTSTKGHRHNKTLATFCHNESICRAAI